MKKEICKKISDMMDSCDKVRDAGLTAPDDIEQFTNISYGSDEKWNLLDVYRPKAMKSDSLPVIFSVHGGGWVYGDKELYRYYCMELASFGFVVVNFSYRLSPDIVYPEHLQDVNAAMRWTAARISEYGGDMDKLFLIGDSAGGQMAAMYACALSNHVCRERLRLDTPDVKLRGIALNCGVYDIEKGMRKADESMSNEENEILVQSILGESYGENEKELGRPWRFVTPDFPRAYIMSSNGDFLLSQQHLMTEALEENEVPFEYHVYGSEKETLYHVFHCDIRSESAKKCNAAECAFFRRCIEEDM